MGYRHGAGSRRNKWTTNLQTSCLQSKGVSVAEVGTYLTALESQPDGSWMAYFGTEIERSPDARTKLNAARTLLIPAWFAEHWVDRDIG